ncbi:hypothetical protein [Methylobacterium sp. E-066]|uniref:hypothetical protein n=1 Tax=Methylobacterium sp. E-066 TaxID=2836584 RepID=UPI001FB96038|nr:hypothetical protein [Methylobacterium sp. E-066]MCJ2142779.1 hypothetical protein [Methylobacterium sp. E-066]
MALPSDSPQSTASTVDPHAAREAEARALYRHFRESEWGWAEPNFSPADLAASEAHVNVMEYAREASAMPPPTTLAGLAALALTAAFSEEQAMGARRDIAEDCLIALIHGVLNVAGVALPSDYRGLVYRVEEGDPCA